MVHSCEDYLTYKKVDPYEIIDVGDVIMIDPDSGYITKAVRGDDTQFPINTRLVVGVCVKSNNLELPNITIDGGKSKDVDRILLKQLGSAGNVEHNVEIEDEDGVEIDIDDNEHYVEIDDDDTNNTKPKLETIIIYGGTSEQNQREIIQIAYSGEWPVNMCGFVDIGDKLGISEHAGKAKSIEYIDDENYFLIRSIGKAVKYMKNKEQVKVLLDIE